MKTLFALLLCLAALPVLAQDEEEMILLQAAAATGGGGGSPTWYDVETVANGNTAAGFSSGMHWASVTPSISGNCTKIRVYIKSFGGASDVKAALYNNAGALISGANGTASAVGADQWLEITLGTPTAVVASTAYKIGWQAQNTNVEGWNLAGSGALSFGSQDYATFPPANTPTDLGPFTQNWCVSIYVEP